MTVVASAAIAACGSSSKPTGSGSNSYAQGVKFADCMRSHGVPNYPDPNSGESPNINQAAPAYVSASKACAKLRPGGPPKPITPAQLAAMTAWARCVRAHGVPDLGDPRVGPGGQGVENGVPANWNPNAPAVIKATKACNHVGIALFSPGG